MLAAGTGISLFLLGLMSGVALLALSAYRRASPFWLKWLLIATGAALIFRYVLMAIAALSPEAPLQPWTARGLWMIRFVGLTLPAVCAIDQIIRHPAMSPQKLLRWYGAALLVVGAALCSNTWLLPLAQLLFLAGLVGGCVALARKIPSWPIQRALAGLSLAYGLLLADSLLLLLGWASRSPDPLYPELAALLGLWYAYETAAALQQMQNT